MEQVCDTQLKCCFHKEEYVTYLCIDLNCKESTRLLCGDCAIFIPYHKDHIHNIVKIKNIQQSTDGSSLTHLKNAIIAQSSIMTNQEIVENRTFMNANQVNLFFDLKEKQMIGEISKVRKSVITIVNMQDKIHSDINQSIIQLESVISKIIENTSNVSIDNSSIHSDIQEYNSIKCIEDINSQDIKVSTSNNNLTDIFLNNQQNLNNILTSQNLGNECEISREITSQLNKIYENSSEQIIELEILMKQQLKKCEVNLIRFSEDLNSFLSSYLPRKQLLEFTSIHKMLDNRFGFEMSNGDLQLLDPAEFYQGMGFKHCIAVNQPQNLQLLRRASTLICHQSGDEDDLLQNHQQGMIIPQQVETQRQYLFSVFFDNKRLNDVNINPISEELARLSYIQNIHLDFDDNDISSEGYKSIFNQLKKFNCLKHIDLRFNNNYIFDEEAVLLLADVLNTHKQTLRALCITMRSQRQKKLSNQNNQYNSNSCPNSPYPQQLDSSQESCTSSFSSSSTYFHSVEHPEFQKNNSTQIMDNSLNINNFTFVDSLRVLLEAIGNLSNLEVLYLDISHNNLKSISGQELFSPLSTLKKLEMLHFVFNKTHLSQQEAIQIIHNFYSESKTLKYFKLFLKENNYSFQQQRQVSGQFQKIQAKYKNFDLFY